MRRVRSAALALVVTIASGSYIDSAVFAQSGPRPYPETYHWVLPANLSGVEVAVLHANDCYAVQEAQGMAYFGTLPASLVELQRQVSAPYAHRVETRKNHSECRETICLRVATLTHAIEQEFTGIDSRLLRGVAHRPTPVDAWFGGAYTDVGSDNRRTYRNAPEQQMIFRHLGASARGNCYEAKALRTLSIHVRDPRSDRQSAGIYSGFLYIEHHHSMTVGEQIAGE